MKVVPNCDKSDGAPRVNLGEAFSTCIQPACQVYLRCKAPNWLEDVGPAYLHGINLRSGDIEVFRVDDIRKVYPSATVVLDGIREIIE